MTRLIFLGPPGAGKGTQASILSESCDVPHISTGAILRDAVDQHTELGKKAEFYMNAGELVPDDLMLDLIRERLTQPDTENGWILDGFPRNLEQAKFLDQLLEEIEQPCQVVINLEVPNPVLIERLLARGREDDTEAVIRNRLEVYAEQTKPLIELYEGRHQLVSIDGDRPPEDVTADLIKTMQA